jgi:competence protein ComEA
VAERAGTHRPVVPSRRVPPVVLLVGAVALLGIVALGWRYLARPAPIEERLPMTGSTVGVDGSPSTAAAAGGDGAGGGPTAGAAPAPDTGAGTDGPVFVHVAGAVAAPGVVQLPAAARVVDAVAAAGGLRADADPDRVNLAAPLVDGSRVVVPAVGQEPPPESATVPPTGAGTGSAAGTDGTAAAAAPGTPLDLNTATAEQLDTLPGVGPATAGAIVDHRSTNGPFDSVDALLDVRGIGDAKLEALRDLVRVG